MSQTLFDKRNHVHRPGAGGWLPRDHRKLHHWVKKKVELVDTEEHRNAALHPVVAEFQKLIENDAGIYMLFHQMFEQVPSKPPYNNDPTGTPQVRNYRVFLRLLNHILTTAPDFENDDLVGFPINAILDWPMGTPAGQAAFLDERVNIQFKKYFDSWVSFLSSSASCRTLNNEDNGWFGPTASSAMPDFAENFICDPSKPHYGFTSWDNFFTRQFRPGRRPVQFPENNDIIVSACESTVYCISYKVKEVDNFWLKEEPYSLRHMLANDPHANEFTGGTVYQAFLSATKYHRWHSPVDGTIVKIKNIPGTYYLESPEMGFSNPDGPDTSGPNLSQGFITSVAARALVFIKADNPAIGLMCFVACGMAEVSSCEITVKRDHKVKKGDQLGMFHFGGSTHCLVFRPETKVTFTVEKNENVMLSTPIATIGK